MALCNLWGRKSASSLGKERRHPNGVEAPNVPDWKRERQEALKWDGLPPLDVDRVSEARGFRQRVSSPHTWNEGHRTPVSPSAVDQARGVVIVHGGRITCAGVRDACNHLVPNRSAARQFRRRVLAPAFISFGSNLGLQELVYEPSTGDGIPFDPFAEDVPGVMRDLGGIVQAADALEFQTRNACTRFSFLVRLFTPLLTALLSG
jgi:hypothetical protein